MCFFFIFIVLQESCDDLRLLKLQHVRVCVELYATNVVVSMLSKCFIFAGSSVFAIIICHCGRFDIVIPAPWFATKSASKMRHAAAVLPDGR